MRKLQNLRSGGIKDVQTKTFYDFSEKPCIELCLGESDLKAIFLNIFLNNWTILDLFKKPTYIETKACWLSHINSSLKLDGYIKTQFDYDSLSKKLIN